MSKLFSPYTIKDVTFKNRIVMSPMCMYSCMDEDGKVTDWHRVHYTSRAVGQVGLIIVEATAVTPQGRISFHDLGIWSDEHIEGLAELVRLSHQHGAKIGIQLAHAGRKATVDGPIIAPSAIPFNENMKTPAAMTAEQIEETIAAFREGARRAKAAGFDVVEIHAAHGYLINQFLSPLSNHRHDTYGGDRDRRYRFLQEVIEAVKEEWDGPLFVRISASDYHPEGLTVDDYVYYAQKMKAQGVDLIDCSSGGVVPAKINVYPGYQVPFAEKIRAEANIATGAVGLITSGWQAEEILQNERADLVFLARELLRDPYWPRRAAQELNMQIEGPRQYERAW
ncbi:NADPH dehydrogenase [Caldalkalibacillus thermarum TA2.A1]|uniref:NADPH dehydrogenase n=1 Tax=Caldalkalibacillus thermarum (strain TA2.A1) TaxID=986075 RepID=F5L743_CALTT|nr:NADPH dehydrogenase NamA [Caldalkalibacillus thermarum]EGL82819.1 NADPH dehydrogenase [Caldalkalibacillus thermarum TA2.A1]QZT34877.1 NADPH dehydrogenase NamA [Caldalkalibacillus thermarum TA2.A1]